MPQRVRSNTVAIPLKQVDGRTGQVFLQGGVNMFGQRQLINETSTIYFTDNQGKVHKLTAVLFRKVRLKTGLVDGSISQQRFTGAAINTDWQAYSPMEVGYSYAGTYPKLTALSNASIIKAYAKLDRMEVAGGENLATLKDTIRLVRNPLSSVAKLGREMINSAKRKTNHTRDVVKYYKNLADAVSNQWLQYRYGIMPLVYDCAGAAAIMENELWMWENRLKTVRAVTRFKDRVAMKTTGSCGYYSTVNCDGVESVDHKVVTTIYFVDKLHMKAARNLEEWGLSPTQLPALAYELIPFSFVADWAFNVGDWLKAIAPKPTIEIKASILSYKRSIRRNMNVVLTSFQPGSLKSYYSFKVDEMDRTLNPKVPSSPGLTSQGLSIKRQIDSLALGWSLWPSKTIGAMLSSNKKKH